MSAFDPADYERRVIRPLRSRAGALPDDLVERYDVDLAMGPAQLAERLRAVRAYWSAGAQGMTQIRTVCISLRTADVALVAEHGEQAMLSPAWWQAHAAGRQRRRDPVPVTAPVTGPIPVPAPIADPPTLPRMAVPRVEPGSAEQHAATAEVAVPWPSPLEPEPARTGAPKPRDAPAAARPVTDVTPPVRRLHAARRGEEIVVGWVWPDGVQLAEVSWGENTLHVTHQQYLRDGGVHLPAAGSAQEIRVVAVPLHSGGLGRPSTTAVVTVASRLPRARYTVDRVGNRLRRNERCVVTVEADTAMGTYTVALCAAPGSVLPVDRSQGEELVRSDVRLGPLRRPSFLEAPMPRLPRPYWLRLFVIEGDLRLVDPPVAQLKVT